jgi:hypothetical protein
MLGSFYLLGYVPELCGGVDEQTLFLGEALDGTQEEELVAGKNLHALGPILEENVLHTRSAEVRKPYLATLSDRLPELLPPGVRPHALALVQIHPGGAAEIDGHGDVLEFPSEEGIDQRVAGWVVGLHGQT